MIVSDRLVGCTHFAVIMVIMGCDGVVVNSLHGMTWHNYAIDMTQLYYDREMKLLCHRYAKAMILVCHNYVMPMS